MPRGDKTGPSGQGPRTGRGMGPCGHSIEDANDSGIGRGQGQGRFARFCGYFRRRGGFGQRNGGRGRQNFQD